VGRSGGSRLYLRENEPDAKNGRVNSKSRSAVKASRRTAADSKHDGTSGPKHADCQVEDYGQSLLVKSLPSPPLKYFDFYDGIHKRQARGQNTDGNRAVVDRSIASCGGGFQGGSPQTEDCSNFVLDMEWFELGRVSPGTYDISREQSGPVPGGPSTAARRAGRSGWGRSRRKPS
jgi:hypothetical protein